MIGSSMNGFQKKNKHVPHPLQQCVLFLPAGLHRSAKDYAEQNGMSTRELYRQLLRPALEKIAAGESPLQ